MAGGWDGGAGGLKRRGTPTGPIGGPWAAACSALMFGPRAVGLDGPRHCFHRAVMPCIALVTAIGIEYQALRHVLDQPTSERRRWGLRIVDGTFGGQRTVL